MDGRLLARLSDLVGPAGVIAGPDGDRYLTDERKLYRGRAAAIVLPASTGELAAVVALCHEAGIGMVPQGGNTGYCGGATPSTAGDEILIVLSRMNRIRAIDRIGATLTLEAGVVLADAQRAAADHGLLLPLSMGSEGTCQIGGNLATNAGGLAVLRYGTARDLVLGLEVVLPDGRIWEGLKALRKDNTGYDLKQLFLGAEGTLGIISAAVLKLFPIPTARETAWLAVRDLDAASEILGLARREVGDCVTSFEYVTRPSLALALAAVPRLRDPLDAAYAHYVLVECSASGATGALGEAMTRLCEGALAAGLALDGVIAASGAHRAALWALRENVPAGEKAAGGAIKHDVSVPIARLPELARRAAAGVAAAVPAARLSVYGHVGDGNLHFNVLAPAGADPQAFRSVHGEAVAAAVHGAAAALGGSFSAEHGVGRLKRELLAATESAVALDLMRGIKGVLDPRGLMNPGKVL